MADDALPKQPQAAEKPQKTEPPTPTQEPVAPTPTEEPVQSPPKVSTEEQEPEVASTEKVAEKKQSLFARLTKIDEVKAEAPVKKPQFDSNSDGYVSAREAINALDSETTIEALTEEEKIAQEVGQQLQKQAEYLVFRVRKSTVLLFGGILVLLLWLVPLTMVMGQKYGFETVFSDLAARIWPPQAAPTPSPTPQPSPQVVTERIRIKGAADDDRVKRIETALQTAGFVVEVESVEVTEKGVSLAAKQGSDLVNVLSRLLGDDFGATASAVILTDDSDFAAIVMVGEVD